MKRFADLYRRLDRSTATLDKRAALVDYFRDAPPRDAVWALWLLSGGKIGGAKAKIAGSGELREWIAQESGTPPWLVDDSYDQVGDLAETLTLLLDDPDDVDDAPLHVWIEQRLLAVAGKDVETRRALVTGAWHSLGFDQRLAFNKLLTGALRVGVSQRLVQQALAEMSGVDIARIAQRMLGKWAPTPRFLADLLSQEELASDRQQPYPFFLASPLETVLRGESAADAPADAGDADAGGADADNAGASAAAGDDAPARTTRKRRAAAADGDPPARRASGAVVDNEASTQGHASNAPDPVVLAGDPAAVERALGDIRDWLLEWKWDGIRLQLIRRDGEVALWSRGEERLDGRFPEIEAAAAELPRNCVLDGELLAWRPGDHAPLPFTALQTRIQRLKPGAKSLADTPVRMQCYDLLEVDGEDLRERPMVERREMLERLLSTVRAQEDALASRMPSTPSFPRKREPMDVAPCHATPESDGRFAPRSAGKYISAAEYATSLGPRLRGDDEEKVASRDESSESAAADAPHPRIVISPRVHAASWAEAAALRASARERGVEGLMLKRLDSTYQVGRRRGDWWKWKIDPLTVDAVLLYAQSGHGRRSTLYTDYTFGLWDGDALVPVAKAYSGLDDKEILELDKWIRAHTLERFGPVRSVRAHHVFELGFEAVNRSTRHKSGIAVRFPRILRWRREKPMAEADRLDTLKALAR